jgi:hypothetical protein
LTRKKAYAFERIPKSQVNTTTVISMTGTRKVDAFYTREEAETALKNGVSQQAGDGRLNSAKIGDFTRVTLGKKR